MSAQSSDNRLFIRRVLIVAFVAMCAVIILYLLRHFAQVFLLVFAGILLAVFLDGLAKGSRKGDRSLGY